MTRAASKMTSTPRANPTTNAAPAKPEAPFRNSSAVPIAAESAHQPAEEADGDEQARELEQAPLPAQATDREQTEGREQDREHARLAAPQANRQRFSGGRRRSRIRRQRHTMPPGVPRDVDDGHRRQNEPDDQAIAHAREQRQAGDRLADADGERVHEGAGEARSGADQGDRPADHFVVAEPPRKEDEAGQKGQGLLRHADRPAADREQEHERRQDDLPPPARRGDHAGDQRVERAGRLQDAERPADDEDVEDDRGGRREAPRPGEEDVAETGRLRRDRPVRGRIDQLPALDLGALILPRRQEVRGHRRERRRARTAGRKCAEP